MMRSRSVTGDTVSRLELSIALAVAGLMLIAHLAAQFAQGSAGSIERSWSDATGPVWAHHASDPACGQAAQPPWRSPMCR